MLPIILLHGALGEQSDLNTLSNSFGSKYTIYRFNFSGHGSQPFQSNFDINQFSKELKNFILENQLEKPHVFGYSMGGYVALNLALTDGDLLGKIITLGTKFNWEESSTLQETNALHKDILQSRAPQYLESLIKKHGTNWELLLEKTRSMMMDIMQKNYLNIDSVGKINNPILIGIADNDKMVTYEETQKIFKAFSEADMYILPKSKHPIESANIEMLSEIITNFIG